MATTKAPVGKKASTKSTAAKKRSTTASGRTAPSGEVLKDPKGGLTAAGRAAFKKSEGADLKPGVKGAADTPEKMKRKGSFLRRHFANLRGPLMDDKGQPTRLALQAHAWGEPVPKTEAAARKLADKGAKLLEQYRAAKSDDSAAPRKNAAKKSPSETKSVRKGPARKSPAKKSAGPD